MAVSNNQPVSAENLKAALDSITGGGTSEKQSTQVTVLIP